MRSVKKILPILSKLKTQYVITRWALDCFSDRMRPIELFKYKKGRWISQTVHDGDWRMRDTSVFSEKLFLKRCG